MKKLYAIVLSVAMMLCLFGTAACLTSCAKKGIDTEKVYSETIPLGGKLNDYELSGKAFGDYKEIEPFDGFDCSDEVDEQHLYASDNCDTRYIATYRWKKNGETFEDEVKKEADIYSEGFYQIIDDEFFGTDKVAYIVCPYTIKDEYYFVQFILLEDGDDIVEVSFCSNSEEVQLGNSDKWIWIPAGGENVMEEGDKEYGVCCYNTYDLSYNFPDIWVGEFGLSYDYAKWYWEGYYEDGKFPLSEEDYFKYFGTDYENTEYEKIYNAFGLNVEYKEMGEKEDCEYYIAVLSGIDYPCADENLSIYYDGIYYDIWLSNTDPTWATYIGDSIIKSLHTVEGSAKEKIFVDSIPLGGNCDDYVFVGDAFGKYKEIKPEGKFAGDESYDTHVYEDSSCDTPYIATYRWKKNGRTLEEMAAEEVELFGAEDYRLIDASAIESVPGDTLVSIAGGSSTEDGGFHYYDTSLFEDGDDFVELVFVKNTEEVQIGNTDTYVWIPSGYNSYLNDDESSHGAFLFAGYAKGYCMPVLWAGKADGSYEYAQWFWEDEYPDGLPVTAEEYYANDEKISAAANDEEESKAMGEYYELFGYEMYDSSSTEIDDISCDVYKTKSKSDGTLFTDVFVYLDKGCFEFTLSEYEDFPLDIASALVKSIHTKADPEKEGRITDSIPLGGEMGDFDITGSAYGAYEEIPAEGTFAPVKSYETHLYYDPDCDTPYIATYRWKKDGMSLKDAAEEEAKYYDEGYYRIIKDDSLPSGQMVSFCESFEIDNEFYYIDDGIYEDGDDFVEIIFAIKTEEVALGDSGKCLYLPTGYNNYLNRDELEHGAIFRASYDECYCLPSIWLGKAEASYEFQEWFWEEEYPDGLPFTEEKMEAWKKETTFSKEYYKYLGYDVTYERTEEVDGVSCTMFALENDDYVTVDDDILFMIGDDLYELWSTSEKEPFAPFYGLAIIKSLHSK